MRGLGFLNTGVLLWLLAGVCNADENAALYDAAIPKDASFIRLANTTDKTLSVIIDNSQLVVPARQMGSYVILAEGSYPVSVEGLSMSVELAKAAAITVLYNGDSLESIQDSLPDNVKKSQVMFYNFSDEPLSLKTTDGKHAVVDSVAPGHVGVRQVNEVKMPFSVFSGDQSLLTFEPIFLRKGQTYSYVLMKDATGTLYSQSGANTVYTPE